MPCLFLELVSRMCAEEIHLEARLLVKGVKYILGYVICFCSFVVVILEPSYHFLGCCPLQEKLNDREPLSFYRPLNANWWVGLFVKKVNWVN